jgi:formylglycine-generating enzyme required for sulfatase activity
VAVDYDGMFVPAMAERGVFSSEMGSPDYRHPKRTAASFGPAMDHFPLAVMALSLEAIATDPSLLECYAEADGLLFCERDFFSLSDSEALRHVFALLPKSPNLQLLYSLFALVYKKMTLPMELSDCFRLPLPKNNSPKSSSSRTFIVNGVSFVMKLVKAGTFRMGATPEMNDGAFDDEFPVHKVTLTKDYYMGETQVTQALWQAVMGENPSEFKGDDQRPVECVSWNDCQVFIQKLNALTGERFRLPTEAEWEFAARGGNESRGCCYAGSNDLDAVAWHDGNSAEKTHAVAQKHPNELGLYDMSGNVLEWCADWYGENYYQTSPDVDPQGPDTGRLRVLRGGAWYGDAWDCRLSSRISPYPEFRFNFYGLRLFL